MFALTPLAVALQSIGYGKLLSSLQGLLAVTVAPELLEQLGSLAAIKPRRRVRRAGRLLPLVAPGAQPVDESEDEDVLALVGAL